MVVHELSDVDCRDILAHADTARLACAHGEQPYVVPISIVYDHESNCLFGFSALGKKVQWMRANPKVCVEIEDVADRFNWMSIVIFGRYDESRARPSSGSFDATHSSCSRRVPSGGCRERRRSRSPRTSPITSSSIASTSTA